jgi:Cu+-exporting ATPase
VTNRSFSFVTRTKTVLFWTFSSRPTSQIDHGVLSHERGDTERNQPEEHNREMAEFICPMHPDVHESEAGTCPKCGMTLEPETVSASVTHSQYTCPMHPKIVRDQPGNCPICGMTLEPIEVTVEETNPELERMTQRLWVSIGFTLPLLAIMISDLLPSHPIQQRLAARSLGWVELAFATPVVLWGGWPFFQRGWTSIASRHLNMFTLISIGAGSASLAPSGWPDFRRSCRCGPLGRC